MLSVLITLLVGRVIALAVRYAAGSPSQRPSAEAIAAALGSADEPVTEMRRVPVSGVESRRYAAVTPDGGQLDVTVFDRDQQAAGLLYRLYRLVRLRDQVARRAPLSTERLAERRALLAYAVEDAGVRTPRLRAVLRAGPEAMALATEADGGTSLAELGSAVTDPEVEHAWDAVLRLHAHRVTHRSLTADKIVICPDDQIKLLDPGGGDIAASDLQLRLDLAQLLAELATLAGRTGPPTWRCASWTGPSWSGCCRCCSRWCWPGQPGCTCGGTSTCCRNCGPGCSPSTPVTGRPCRRSGWSGSGRAA